MELRAGRATAIASCLAASALPYFVPPPIASAVSAAPERRQAQPQGALWSVATVATAGGVLAACPVSGIRPLREQSLGMRRVLGTTAAVLSPAYATLKTAVVGAGVGASAWMFLLSFDWDLARGTMDIARNGDWRLRPEHMTCERPIQLLAPRVESEAGREAPLPP
jgi:hypothetical protein